MARPRNSLFFASYVHVFFAIITVSTSWKPGKSEQQPKHVAFFIFGDSFFDAGNNNYINTTTLDQANFWPYGETYFKFPTGRFSDGRLVPDFIAEHASVPLIPPFLQPGIHDYPYGANFASGGAGALVETFQGDVIDLKTQLRNYKKVEKWLLRKLGKDGDNMRISKAVFLFSIGSNDYMSAFLTNNSTLLKSYSHSEYVGMVIGNITHVLKEIYETGGRKFAFINLPPLGCLPAIRIIKPENNGSCLAEISLLVKLHNKALSKLLVQLEKQLQGFKYSFFDVNTIIQKRMFNPSKYGFKEGKAACCGSGKFRGVYSCGGKRGVKEFELCEDPKEYLFWDSYHLTEKAYRQLADEMWSGHVRPYNVHKLFQL